MTCPAPQALSSCRTRPLPKRQRRGRADDRTYANSPSTGAVARIFGHVFLFMVALILLFHFPGPSLLFLVLAFFQAAGLAPAFAHALRAPVSVTTSPFTDSVIPDDPRVDFSPVAAALARVGEVHTIMS